MKHGTTTVLGLVLGAVLALVLTTMCSNEPDRSLHSPLPTAGLASDPLGASTDRGAGRSVDGPANVRKPIVAPRQLAIHVLDCDGKPCGAAVEVHAIDEQGEPASAIVDEHGSVDLMIPGTWDGARLTARSLHGQSATTEIGREDGSVALALCAPRFRLLLHVDREVVQALEPIDRPGAVLVRVRPATQRYAIFGRGKTLATIDPVQTAECDEMIEVPLEAIEGDGALTIGLAWQNAGSPRNVTRFLERALPPSPDVAVIESDLGPDSLLFGRVVCSGGSAASAVRLELHFDDTGSQPNLHTDADGRFAQLVRAGATGHLRLDDSDQTSVEWNAGEFCNALFDLRENVRIQLFDESGGAVTGYSVGGSPYPLRSGRLPANPAPATVATRTGELLLARHVLEKGDVLVFTVPGRGEVFHTVHERFVGGPKPYRVDLGSREQHGAMGTVQIVGRDEGPESLVVRLWAGPEHETGHQPFTYSLVPPREAASWTAHQIAAGEYFVTLLENRLERRKAGRLRVVAGKTTVLDLRER